MSFDNFRVSGGLGLEGTSGGHLVQAPAEAHGPTCPGPYPPVEVPNQSGEPRAGHVGQDYAISLIFLLFEMSQQAVPV